MTIAGNLAFQSGALYLVQVNPTTCVDAPTSTRHRDARRHRARDVRIRQLHDAQLHHPLCRGRARRHQFGSLTTGNLPAGFTASLSYTSTDVILNLTAAGCSAGIGTGGLSHNQQNVAEALNNFFNNGGTLPPNFVTVFGLTGANLGNALTQLSGEAATGAQQVALPDEQPVPRPDARSVRRWPRRRRRRRWPGASALRRSARRVPPTSRSPMPSVLKAPPQQAPIFEPRWSVWGGGLRRLQTHRRRCRW